jgi:hypothetical protein
MPKLPSLCPAVALQETRAAFPFVVRLQCVAKAFPCFRGLNRLYQAASGSVGTREDDKYMAVRPEDTLPALWCIFARGTCVNCRFLPNKFIFRIILMLCVQNAHSCVLMTHFPLEISLVGRSRLFKFFLVRSMQTPSRLQLELANWTMGSASQGNGLFNRAMASSTPIMSHPMREWTQ